MDPEIALWLRRHIVEPYRRRKAALAAVAKARACRHNKSKSDICMISSDLKIWEFTIIKREFAGRVTIDWQGYPTLPYRGLIHCKLCGTEYWTGFGVLPRGLIDFPRDATGWPIKPDGTRIEADL